MITVAMIVKVRRNQFLLLGVLAALGFGVCRACDQVHIRLSGLNGGNNDDAAH